MLRTGIAFRDDYRGLTISICATILLGAAGGFLFILLAPACTDTSPDTITDAQAQASVIAWVNVSTDWETLVALLKHEEGFRAFAYPDTRGYWTIGYGTKLPLTGADKNCVNVDNLSGYGPGLTLGQGDCLLRYRLSGHFNDIQKRWAPYKHQTGPVQMALLDMVYQLGVNGLLEFKSMLGAIVDKDWPRAILEARSSRWDKETPSRVERVVVVFEGQEV